MSNDTNRSQLPLPEAAKRHFESRRAEIDAVAEPEPIRLEVPQAVSIALGAVPRLTALLPRIAELPGINGRRVAELESYALAAWYAHLVLRTEAVEDLVEPYLEEAKALRRTLLSDAEALAQRGFVQEARVTEIRAGRGHVDLANDLVSLANLFQGVWDQVKGRTLVEEVELERASELGSQLLVLLARRQGVPVEKGMDELTRAKAFTLLLAVYDDAQRAVAYLRWSEGDASAVTPSLYKRRARKKAPASPAEAPSADGSVD